MKRSLTLLLASLLVVAGLSACGSSDDGQNQAGSDSAVTGTDTAGNGNTAASDGTAGEQTDSSKDQDSLMDDMEQGMDNAVQGTKDALDDAADDMTDGDRLKDAQVHDQDGDLTDQENNTSRSSTR